MKREPPLVKGGQGRTGDEVVSCAAIAGVCVGVALTMFILSLAALGAADVVRMLS